MRIAVCDDEQMERERIAGYIRQYDPELAMTEFASAGALQAAMAEGFYDIIFMDIEMDAPNGYDVARALMEEAERPLIIFVTKSSAYTIRGYGVAFRYLQKPVTCEQLSEVLSLALQAAEPRNITIHTGNRTVVLSVREILYIEILNHQLYIHTTSETCSAWMSLSDIKGQLCSSFAQPHKSYYVNMAHIQCVQGKEILLTDGTTIPLSLRRKEPFLSGFRRYLRNS